VTDTPSDRPPSQPPAGPPQGPPPAQGPGGAYPAPGYPAPGYPAPGYPAATRRRNGMGTTALVLGILALVLVVLLLFSPLGAFLGLLAVLFGILGLIRANRGEADNRGQAVTGLVTGAVALIFGILFTISVGTWFATHVNDFRRFGNCMDNAVGANAREQCARELSNNLD
jgi:hypothetical protein